MTEKVYRDYFAMDTDKKLGLAVVVESYWNDQWAMVDCKIISDPLPSSQAQSEATRKNLDAQMEGDSIYSIPAPRIVEKSGDRIV